MDKLRFNLMNKKFGIMQGRLLPKYKGKFQAHPLGYWKDEFPIASKLGLDSIEFILDYNDVEKNPLMHKSGVKEILDTENSTGIKVRSICADYFMEAPIHSDNTAIVDKSLKILQRLIENSSMMNITDIVIPCVDQSSLKNQKDINNLIVNLKMVLSIVERKNINLSLETDLEPLSFANLLDKIGSENVTVNYDIGNSASLGFDSDEEFKAYGDKITDLHIKDRLLGGGSVVLGTGNVDFKKIFNLLSKYEFKGLIIFQAFRDDEGLEIFKKQMSWLYNNFKL
tara:strand:+ start:368 stop:1216 length:849 start_codon:yes stop_codon:yes gene_type:complete